jgi:hypothetical protein
MALQQCTWKRSPKLKRGILCGAEASQEWLLPWWWSRYIEHNHFPVTFIDFGMTQEMRDWCAEKGEVIPVEIDPACITPRSGIVEESAKEWEKNHGWKVWNARHTWFKKPGALLHSPYKQTVWIDIDCEILGPLDPLFKEFDRSREMALVREYACDHIPKFDPRVRYNGGIILFQHGSPILEKFAEGALTQNHLFAGDDNLLSHMINSNRLEVQELPEIYNWRMARGLNLNAVVLHWVGNGGKAYIRSHGGLKPSLDSFYQTFKGKF